MAAYLLQCQCGKAMTIEPRQAGDRLQCPCGATLDVPPLRLMRELPSAETGSDAGRGRSKSSSGWGLQQAVLAGGLVIAAVLVISGIVIWQYEPREYVRSEYVAAEIDRWSPLAGWATWTNNYRALLAQKTLDRSASQLETALANQIQQFRIARYAFFGLGGLAAVGGVIGYFSAPRQTPPSI